MRGTMEDGSKPLHRAKADISKRAVQKYRRKKESGSKNSQLLDQDKQERKNNDAPSSPPNSDSIWSTSMQSAKRTRVVVASLTENILNIVEHDDVEALKKFYGENNLHVNAHFELLLNCTGTHLSAYFGAIECLKELLAAGGSTSLRNDVGRDPFWYCDMNELKEADLHKQLCMVHLSRIPGIDRMDLEMPYSQLQMKKALRVRFRELQRYQTRHDPEPVPTALVDQFLLAIKNDNVELFRSLIEENEVNINAPILDISPVLERTYLLHEIAKNVPTNENLTKYIEGLDENTIDLNKVDAHGRDAHWYETLEHLELSVLQRS